ncbi:type 1 glutamine amidotransferase domain-containing protein [Aquibaculum arenosum]|uniref:Type 1 glutamine amidotransferase n=1 Tax=Aquibaculum arenosum TaxID=3032591 RepID=A0ABT5YNZ0_9PROT|nr:type 1 glutamine amidotransferase domain-containing protein [Fodinicurvata sp. CAU 1616]MDF2096679.1 type 1 glutamine amidotransferase [Fodinicurvata sp. CAU 1616]
MPAISNAKIAILATHGFEQSELEVPRDKLRSAGATVHVVTPDGQAIKGWDKTDWGSEVEADKALSTVQASDYDALVLPGGQINPDLLRVNDSALSLIRDFVGNGRIVAAICHAPWLLIEAGVVEGREMTSYHSIRTDVKNAGANWVDREAVVSNGIVTSRNPDDLDAFTAKIIEEIEEGRHERG